MCVYEKATVCAYVCVRKRWSEGEGREGAREGGNEGTRERERERERERGDSN